MKTESFFRMLPGDACRGIYLGTERRSLHGKRSRFIVLSITEPCVISDRKGNVQTAPKKSRVYIRVTVTLENVLKQLRKSAKESVGKDQIEINFSVKENYVLSSGKAVNSVDVMHRSL